VKFKSFAFSVVFLLFLTGCARITPEYEKSLQKGDYGVVSEDLKKSPQDDLLWYLDAGAISRYAKDYNASNFFFDKSESKIKEYDKKVLAGKLLESVGTVLTNDTFIDYTPKIYEGIMVNTYKGINFLNEKDFTNARIEFNRALERQRRAKEFFEKEIAQEKEKIKKEQEKKAKEKNLNKADIQKAQNNTKTQDAIEKRYSNLFAFKPYPDFLNPFTSYMSGLFFIATKDYVKAADILKETYGMIKDNEDGASYVKKDLKYALKRASSLKTKENKHYVWVVFENGKGPKRDELRFDIPLFVVTRGLYYTGIALPTFKEQAEAYNYLRIKNGKKSLQTKQVASMDKVVKTEFKKRFPLIMTRAIARTVTQSLIQYQLKRNVGLVGGIMGVAYQGFMNRADTRQWRQLPKNFQIARVELKSSDLTIENPKNAEIVKLNLDKNKNHIVFVRAIEANTKPIVTKVSF